MVKNKKGKKKNKMAGRNRPDATPTEVGENCVPVIQGDISENEDQPDPPRGPKAVSPASDGRISSDSGIDSGRGSPGDDDPGTSTASSKSRIKAPPKITENQIFEDAESDSVTTMNPDESEEPIVMESLESDLGSPPPPAVDDEKPEEPEEAEQLEEEPEPEPEETKSEDQPKSSERPKTESGRKSEPPTPQMRGATSLKRPKPKEDIKHPLEFRWTFWLSKRNVPWEEALCEVVSFDTVEDFWYYFSRISDPRSANEPIVLFKKGIRPEWEDPANAHGTRWNLNLGLTGIHAARMWKELSLLMIGGIKFGDLTPHLNGIYCGWKPDGIHYSVWIDTLDEQIARRIGNIIHENLLDIFKKSTPMELVAIRGKKRSLAMIR